MKFVSLFARRCPFSLLAKPFGRGGAARVASSLTVRDALNQPLPIFKRLTNLLTAQPLSLITSARSFSMLKKKRRWARNTKKDDEEEEDEEEEEEDEVDEEENDGMPKDYRIREFVLLSRRTDVLTGRAFNASTTAASNAILQGRVRVNDTVMTKKAHELEQGDEVEVWEAPYEDNNLLANVKRLHLLRCRFDKQKGYLIRAKCWQNYITDNWMTEAEEGAEEEEETTTQQQQEDGAGTEKAEEERGKTTTKGQKAMRND